MYLFKLLLLGIGTYRLVFLHVRETPLLVA